jgi:hypothetical protein
MLVLKYVSHNFGNNSSISIISTVENFTSAALHGMQIMSAKVSFLVRADNF